MATVRQSTSPIYRLDDEVNLYELLPALSFTVPKAWSLLMALIRKDIDERASRTFWLSDKTTGLYRLLKCCHYTREYQPYKSLCGFITP